MYFLEYGLEVFFQNCQECVDSFVWVFSVFLPLSLNPIPVLCGIQLLFLVRVTSSWPGKSGKGEQSFYKLTFFLIIFDN